MSVRHFRYCGISPEGDPLNYTLPATSAKHPAWLAAPKYFLLKDGRRVSQWAPTRQSRVTGFNPASDCDGNFMSYKFQVNNNCYNYACNIATNSFAYPGRRHMQSLVAPNGRLTQGSLVAAAKADGLIELGGPGTSLASIVRQLPAVKKRDGHLVALLVSVANSSIRWRGDFHWVRCDDPSGTTSWSQKNGRDQVTNFDFFGNPIWDPSEAKWTVNLGPFYLSGTSAKQVLYTFGAWMFVPFGKVTII
jgi:hypothetical protein